MNIPTWLSPALYGAGAGATALAIIGFTWGGWETAASAHMKATDASDRAVALSLTPYCLERARTDPRSEALMEELNDAYGFQRSGIVEKAGWATPLGADRPVPALARSCERALAAT